ncbi:MAG: OmpA family protein [Deltaproteobacteria bacterium]|nr:OmpA family protein [Deltaproteobacteria bacterium]
MRRIVLSLILFGITMCLSSVPVVLPAWAGEEAAEPDEHLRINALEQKRDYEDKLDQFSKAIEQIHQRRTAVESNTDWMYTQMGNYNNLDIHAPGPLRDAVRQNEGKIKTGEAQIEQLKMRQTFCLRKMRALRAEVMKTYDTLPDWWTLQPEHLRLEKELLGGVDLPAGYEERITRKTVWMVRGGSMGAIADAVKRSPISGMVDVRKDEQGVYLVNSQPILFKSGRSKIDNRALNLARGLAALIKGLPVARIKVEGNADNVPVKRKPMGASWDLSMARANSFAQALIQSGVPAALITVVGNGDMKPIAPNTTKANRQQNRRVDVRVEFGR